MDITLPDISALFGDEESKQDRVSSIESFHIWNGLRTRYISIETYKFYKNLVHDQDLKLIMNEHIDAIQEAIKELEQIAGQNKITTPSQPPEKIKFSEEIDQINDKFIFRKLYAELIFEIYLLTQGMIDSTVNDQLRQLFVSQTLQHLNTFKQFYKYGKLKGWTEIAPSFGTEKQNKKETASESEASHLWNLINLRYDQIRFTKCCKEIAHDVEFRKLLEDEISVFDKMLRYGKVKGWTDIVPMHSKS